MRSNPELVRNLWLELTPHRLVAVPAVIGLLVMLGTALNSSGYGKDVGGWAALGCGALLGLWGSRLAAASVADEAANRTWDGQRLSALTPWQMTWGKLAGSTAIAWYGGLLCLFVFVTASAGAYSARRLAVTAASLVAGAVLCQAVALLGALLELRRGGSSAQRTRGAAAAGGAVVIYWFFGVTVFSGSTVRPGISWFGAPIPHDLFLLGSAAAFGAWSVAGAWRVMREELQTPAPPWVWVGFAGFFMAYLAGTSAGTPDALEPIFGRGVDPLTARLVAAELAGLALVYFAALLDAKDPVVFRRLIARWRAGGAAGALPVLPPWIATVPLVVAAAAAAAVAATASDTARHPAVFVVSCLGFAARDLGLLLAFNFAPNRKRADAATLFYWLLGYGLVPLLVKTMDRDAGLYLFYPMAGGAASVLAPWLQAAATIALLRVRWRGAVAASS